MIPRLSQPLFTGAQNKAKNDDTLYTLVRAYDCIFNLLFLPPDIAESDIRQNAQINLNALGEVLENLLGIEAFTIDNNQLAFPILNNEPNEQLSSTDKRENK